MNARDKTLVNELEESLANGNISWVCDQILARPKREAVFLAVALGHQLAEGNNYQTFADALERRLK